MNNDPIRKFIDENPIYLSGHYQELADKFSISYEQARHLARRARKKKDEPKPEPIKKDEQTSSFKENTVTGEANLAFTTSVRIKTKQDLIDLGMLDLEEFDIVSYEVGSWEGYRKNKSANLTWTEGVMDGYVHDNGGMHLETLYKVSVKLQRRKLDKDLQKQKALILAEIKSGVGVDLPMQRYSQMLDEINEGSPKCKYLLEVCVPDAHFGKQSWNEETGEDYDLKIAENRFKTAIYDLLKRFDLSSVERILFPIGNDLINIDNKFNTTTAGTPQDTDSRFFKIIKVVRRVLVEVINDLSLIAPVDVLIVPGNHDESTSFFIGEILDAFYHNNPLVNIDCRARMRKYYQYGKVGLQLSHGNEEKHHDLGLIFATEEKDIWASTNYRFAQLGHYHKNKSIQYTSVDEFQGFQVQVLPSLSGTDVWHKKKGFMSKKQAKAFLFDKEEGLIGEFTVSI